MPFKQILKSVSFKNSKWHLNISQSGKPTARNESVPLNLFNQPKKTGEIGQLVKILRKMNIFFEIRISGLQRSREKLRYSFLQQRAAL